MPGGKCQYCGADLSENAIYCKHCLVPVVRPTPKRRPSNFTLCLSVAMIFGLPCVWAITGQVKANALATTTVQAAAKPAVPVSDPVQMLISSCGKPDQDMSTADNDPPPPIPFRVLTYAAAHLQFDFVPGPGSQMGDPSPHQWLLSGILDTSTNQQIGLADAAQRMSCVDPSIGAGPAPAQQ